MWKGVLDKTAFTNDLPDDEHVLFEARRKTPRIGLKALV